MNKLIREKNLRPMLTGFWGIDDCVDENRIEFK